MVSNAAQPYAGQVAFRNYTSANSAASVMTALVPTIPDGALGYEIDAGFDWKLLEGLTARCTFGYWVPGNWFELRLRRQVSPKLGRFQPKSEWGVGHIAWEKHRLCFWYGVQTGRQLLNLTTHKLT